MTILADYQLLSFILVIGCTDAIVTIHEVGWMAGDEHFECGKGLTLSCQIDTYTFSMAWKNDSSAIPLAQCMGSDCTLNPSLKGLYTFSFNTSQAIFNLTIVQVTFENNGTIYLCTNGSASSSSVVTVKDYEPTVDESTPGQIIVSSGCVNPNTEVSFQWIKIKATSGIESDYNPIYISTSTNTTSCLADTRCGQSNFIQKTKTITTEQGGNLDYRLKVILIYDGVRFESSLTDGKYVIKEQAEVSVCIYRWPFIVLGILLFIFFIAVCALLISDMCKFKKQRSEKYTSSCMLKPKCHPQGTCGAVMSSIAITGVYILSVVYCICEESDVFCDRVVTSCYVLGCLLVLHFGIGYILHSVWTKEGNTQQESNCFTSENKGLCIAVSIIPWVGIFPIVCLLVYLHCRESCTTNTGQIVHQIEQQESMNISVQGRSLLFPHPTETRVHIPESVRKEEHMKINKVHERNNDDQPRSFRREKKEKPNNSSSQIDIELKSTQKRKNRYLDSRTKTPTFTIRNPNLKPANISQDIREPDNHNQEQNKKKNDVQKSTSTREPTNEIENQSFSPNEVNLSHSSMTGEAFLGGNDSAKVNRGKIKQHIRESMLTSVKPAEKVISKPGTGKQSQTSNVIQQSTEKAASTVSAVSDNHNEQTRKSKADFTAVKEQRIANKIESHSASPNEAVSLSHSVVTDKLLLESDISAKVNGGKIKPKNMDSGQILTSVKPTDNVISKSGTGKQSQTPTNVTDHSTTEAASIESDISEDHNDKTQARKSKADVPSVKEQSIANKIESHSASPNEAVSLSHSMVTDEWLLESDISAKVNGGKIKPKNMESGQILTSVKPTDNVISKSGIGKQSQTPTHVTDHSTREVASIESDISEDHIDKTQARSNNMKRSLSSNFTDQHDDTTMVSEDCSNTSTEQRLASVSQHTMGSVKGENK